MFSGTFVFLAFGEPPTSVEGTRDYSTDFFPPRYLKLKPVKFVFRFHWYDLLFFAVTFPGRLTEISGLLSLVDGLIIW
ncbi:hypothetical protein DT160_23190 [Salmonella enterica subsp. enterica serovar Mikawasima]|nr:hypothetical protein [Salmonella enterica subsp. enterica serovar Mikawasima]